VVAELVETARLYGRIAARVAPEAVERLAGPLVVRNHSEPHWDAARGAAMAYERVTLYGLPLVARRRVGLASIDPEIARELFIRHALVEAQWRTRHHFFRDNQALIAELTELEERARRRDLLVSDDELVAFYDTRIPSDVVSARHFDAWWKKQRHETPDLLTLTRDDVLRHESDDDENPVMWTSGDLGLSLSYRFDPGASDDGVTVHVPVDMLARLDPNEFGWQVPALREELVTTLLRGLPKDLRRAFVPVPDTARAVLAVLTPGQEPLLVGLQRELHRRTGVLVPLDAFDLTKLPAHLRVTFAVENGEGDVVARGKDLSVLQDELAAPVREAVAAAVAGKLERDGLTSWPDDLDVLPNEVERTAGEHVVRGYPALVDRGRAVAIRVLATADEQAASMRAGTRRLLRLMIPSPVRSAERSLSSRSRLVLGANPDGSIPALLEDCADAAVDALVAEPVWSRAAFATLRDNVAAAVGAQTIEVVRRVERALEAAHQVRTAIPAEPPPSHAAAIEDIRDQFRRLLPVGFVVATGRDRLPDIARYLTAAGRRLELLARDVDVDRARMQRIAAVSAAYDDLVAALPSGRASAPDVQAIRWQIEELRVSLWAQSLGTSRPVSEQRIYRAIDAIRL
jgi:ATP-dependent helicase HrpA